MKKFIFLIVTYFFICPYFVSADNLSNYVVMDINSHRVFNELSKDEVILPASTTKIMTAIVAIENSNLYDVIKTGNEIFNIDGTNIYAEVGENFLMLDLLYGMLLRSGNDAAMILANYVGYSNVNNFVKLMNEKAKIIGAKNTFFENPTGLDDNTKNSSSCYDLALIYSYAYNNDVFKNVIGAKEYKTSSDKKSYYFKNRTDIIRMDDRITGGKTGYTPKAGRLLVSSASYNNLDIVIASRGDGYGYKNHIRMYDDVFSNYKNYIVLDKDSFDEKFKGDGKLYIKNSFSYPLSLDEVKSIDRKIVYNGKKSGNVGDILIYLDDKVIHKEKLFLKDNRISFFDRIKNFFHIA